MPCFVFGRPWVSIEFTLEPSYDVGRSASYYRYYLLTNYLGLLTNSYYLSITLHRSRRLSSYFVYCSVLPLVPCRSRVGEVMAG